MLGCGCRHSRSYNADVRRLIINADDFGLTDGINRGIVEAHSNGIVSSATLMANAGAFEGAIGQASALPKLSVGCHVILVDGVPVMDASEIPTLVTRQPNGGRFHENLSGFARRALMGRIDPAQIEAEALGQIRKLQSSAVAVSHLDSHKHTHMFPVVYRALLRAAQACGIRAIRNPFSPLVSVTVRALHKHPTLWKRHLQVRGLRRLEAAFLRAVADAGMITTDGCFGVIATGALDLSLFEWIMKSVPQGTWEFVCHPGYTDSDLEKVKTRLRESRVEELEVLTSREARHVLERQNIELISYRELVAGNRKD
jgi:hopanoid biosynthesis associated protein HpnK